MTSFFFIIPPVGCQSMLGTRHALFRRRVRAHTVARNELSASPSMLLRVVFLSRRRVLPQNVHGHDSARLKPLATFLSLLHVKVQENPLFLVTFHFGPLTFNFVFGLDFCYISFNLVRLGPPIGID